VAFFSLWGAQASREKSRDHHRRWGLDLPRTLAAPIHDTLHFAGEATVFDAQTGTVFGALESGYRAAAEMPRNIK
jgi:hypothetical protein